MPNKYIEKMNAGNPFWTWPLTIPLETLLLLNTTRGTKEKQGGSIVRDQFRERLDDLILDLDLFDIPLDKGMLTWNNRRDGPGHIVARLNRFLINNSLLALRDKFFSLNLPWAGSDHWPIRLVFEAQKIRVPFLSNSTHSSWITPSSSNPFPKYGISGSQAHPITYGRIS